MRGCESNSDDVIIQPFIYGPGLLMEQAIKGLMPAGQAGPSDANLKTCSPA
jgi:hypothetical protein